MGDKTINQKIGARIRKLRREHGYTQEKFAESVDISCNYLSDIERGVSFPKTDKLVAIARVLDCSADDLFCDVIPRSGTARNGALTERINRLSPEKQEKVCAILEAVLQNI